MEQRRSSSSSKTDWCEKRYKIKLNQECYCQGVASRGVCKSLAFAWKENDHLLKRRNSEKPLGKSFPLGTAFLEQTLLGLHMPALKTFRRNEDFWFTQTSNFIRVHVLHLNRSTVHAAYWPYDHGLSKNIFVCRAMNMIHAASEPLCLGLEELVSLLMCTLILGPAQMGFVLLFHEPNHH